MREAILRAARQSESIRGSYDPALIHDLFGTPMEPALAYDVVLRYVNEERGRGMMMMMMMMMMIVI